MLIRLLGDFVDPFRIECVFAMHKPDSNGYFVAVGLMSRRVLIDDTLRSKEDAEAHRDNLAAFINGVLTAAKK